MLNEMIGKREGMSDEYIVHLRYATKKFYSKINVLIPHIGSTLRMVEGDETSLPHAWPKKQGAEKHFGANSISPSFTSHS